MFRYKAINESQKANGVRLVKLLALEYRPERQGCNISTQIPPYL